MEASPNKHSIFEFVANSDEFHSILLHEKSWDLTDKILDNKDSTQDYSTAEAAIEKIGVQGDFPSLYGAIPVFSQHAYNVFKDVLHREVVFHPMQIEGEQFYVAKITNIIDCLDPKRSKLSRNKVTGRVSRIHNYVFDLEKLKDTYLFRVPETQYMEVYFTDKFKAMMDEHELKGLYIDKPIFEKK